MDRFYYEQSPSERISAISYSTSTSETVRNYLKLLSGDYFHGSQFPNQYRELDIYLLDNDLEKIVEFCKLIGVDVVRLPVSNNLYQFYSKIKAYEETQNG